MRTIEEQDARMWFPHLLQEVGTGEDVLITRNGSPLARLQLTLEATTQGEPKRRHNLEEVRAAILRIRERAEALGLEMSTEEILAWRDEGRR